MQRAVSIEAGAQEQVREIFIVSHIAQGVSINVSEDHSQFDVIGLGGCAWDMLGIVDRYPQIDEKVPLIDFQQQGGGQAGTAMATVARLGGKAAIVGNTGDDEFGEAIRQSFVKEGVDVSHLHTAVGATSHIAVCIAVAEAGQRSILYREGTKGKLAPEQLDRNFITNCRCFLTDTHHFHAGLAAARWAREAGIPVVIDLERFKETNEELLAVADYPILPTEYALEFTGEAFLEAAAEKLLTYEPTVLVITRGPEGSIAYSGEGVIEQPAFQVEPVVDTTGAGDVFHGAFAYGLALGYGLKRNLAFASAVAALNCRALGGRGSLPTMEEVNHLLATAPERTQ